NLEFPYKKPKRGELNDEEKEYNRGLSSFRVRVEHRIGRVKRFRIVSERFRNPLRTHDTKVSIVAGLVNLEDGFGPF
ncbi:transposase family protein, partial [Bradyrhizobium sp.]|uniref:transposase family protein n=1 Tax=Bradyrhizobium sp. TaxID=376 RepID=UPI0025C5A8FA